MLKIKPGASIRGLQPQIFHAASVFGCILKEDYDLDAVITCGSNGEHSVGSLHYVGLAVDLRSKHLPGGSTGQAAKTVQTKAQSILGDEYDVVLESTHFHVEYQPKQPM